MKRIINSFCVITFAAVLALPLSTIACSNPVPQTGTKMYVRGTDIRVRQSASTDGAIVGLLQGGMAVEVIEKIEPEVEIAGRRAPWFRVRQLSLTGIPDDRSLQGYVFGAFLVPEEEGPEALMRKAAEFEESDPDRAIAMYKQIEKEFPAEGDPGLYERRFIIGNAIAVLQCWRKKPESALPSESALLMDVRRAAEQNDAQALRERANCVFLQWESPCVGDPLPGPVSDHDISEFRRMASKFDWNTLKEKCVDSIDGKDRYCFSTEQHKGSWYWSGGCIEKKDSSAK